MGRSMAQKSRDLLNYALAQLNSVEYKPSLRWLFYRLVQGYGLVKKDYNNFKSLLARARKNYSLGWRPDSLVDETRSIHEFNTGYNNVADWVNAIKRYAEPNLDKHVGQVRIVQVWFEAQAMYQQFELYTKPYYVDLIPFRGDASIPLKWDISQKLKDYRLDRIPVTVLYYGDYDEKGKQIPQSALGDIRKWAHIDEMPLFNIGPEFEFIHVGLNEEHIEKYDIPENPFKPGEYQWEALRDEGAKELIVGALDSLLDLSKIKKIKEVEKEVGEAFREYIENWEPPEIEIYGGEDS